MATKDPDCIAIQEAYLVNRDETVEDVATAMKRTPGASDLEKNLVRYFLYSKQRFAIEGPDERVTSLQRSFYLAASNGKGFEGKSIPKCSPLHITFVYLRALCLSATERNAQPGTEGVSELERAFIALCVIDFPEDVTNRKLSSDIVKELLDKISELFLAIKATIERATNLGGAEGNRTIATELEVRMIEDTKDTIVALIESYPIGRFGVAFLALNLMVGYLAVEEANASRTSDDDVVPSPGVHDAAAAADGVPAPGVPAAVASAATDVVPAPGVSAAAATTTDVLPAPGVSAAAASADVVPAPVVPAAAAAAAADGVPAPGVSNFFCFDLYLYMAYLYRLISEEDYGELRSRTTDNHFTERLGKSVILLHFAYKNRFWQHLKEVFGVFSENLVKHNALHFISKFVEDSVHRYPNSSYRYLILLSVISEIALLICSENKPIVSYDDYLNTASNYYFDSGMGEFEVLLMNLDNFQSLKEHTERIAKAWAVMGFDVVNALKSRLDPMKMLVKENQSSVFLRKVERLFGVQMRRGTEGEARLEPEGNADAARSQRRKSLSSKANDTKSGVKLKQRGEELEEQKPKSGGKKPKKSKGKKLLKETLP